MPITKIENVTKTAVFVDLDNKRLVGCKFTNCRLGYAGGQCEWDANATFYGCTWELRDAAARTMRIFSFGFGPFSWKDKAFSTQG